MPSEHVSRRWRFQIHLSTAIVLTFAAGGIIWANVRERREQSAGTPQAVRVARQVNRDEFLFRLRKPPISQHEYSISARGWPCESWRSSHEWVYDDGEYFWSAERDGKYFLADGIIVNASVALILLAVVWFLCEWPIRRRAARKEA
jgi:hypothetical protein